MIYWTWLEKCSDYLTGVRLTLRYIGLRLTLKSLNYLTGLEFIFVYIGVGLKKWINQEQMALEKSEGFLELSVKQFVIQSNSISLGQIMCGVWKQTLLLLVAKSVRCFLYQTRVMQVQV